jgi:hypothetical protein
MQLASYRVEYGSFYFGTENNLRFMCQQVSLMFDAESGTVLKHGPAEYIEQYMKSDGVKKLQEHFPIRTVTFDASNEAAEWINTTLASSGSLLPRLKTLLERSSPARA